MSSTICGYEVHEAAELFPLITGPDFEALVLDIIANGQMEPIVLDANDRIIDGRNRARACERMGVAPSWKRYEGADVVQFVVSHNLHRRHLTDSQRAMIAAKLATRAPGFRGHTGNSSYEELPPTHSQAAALLSVTESQVTKAKVVHRDGTPELVQLVAEGHAPVTTAARVATELDDAEQVAYVEQVRGGADPVKAAPPDVKQREYKAGRTQPEPPKPPVMGPRRKHADVIDAIVVAVSGAQMALKGVTELDASVTAEEAARLTRDLSEQIRGLSRINNLIKERTQ